jgi:hypothetical protein
VLDDFGVINKLPIEFRQEVNQCLYLKLFTHMSTLVNGDNGFLAMLCSLLAPQVHLAGEHIMKAGDYNAYLYFIHMGQVEVCPKFYKGSSFEVISL